MMKPSQPHQDDSVLSDARTVEAEVVEFEQLTPFEEEERRRLEEVVERSFVEAGKALKRLRDGRFYRSTHPNFESYVQDRFGFNRISAYNKIVASEAFENLLTNGEQVLPKNERQLRPIVSLEPEQQREIWQQAVSEAGGKVPSGNIVKSVVDRIREKNPAPNPWRVDEIAELLVKANRELYGRGGQWCIISEVHTFSCTVKVWDGVLQVKLENLKTLDLPPDQQKEVLRLCDRLNRLAQIEGLDRSAKVLLASLGKQTFLTSVEEKLLEVLEAEYARKNRKD